MKTITFLVITSMTLLTCPFVQAQTKPAQAEANQAEGEYGIICAPGPGPVQFMLNQFQDKVVFVETVNLPDGTSRNIVHTVRKPVRIVDTVEFNGNFCVTVVHDEDK